MKKILFLLISVLFIVSSCNEDENNNSTNNPDTSLNNYSGPEMVKINDKIFSVPSPIQASALVKEKNIPFNPDLLNKTDNYTKYLTSFKQALNIGVYGANLGNLFIYDQLSQSAEYFNVIKKLSEQVGVMNSINEALIKRIENNNDNRDSLMYIISEVYRQIDSYLLENDQEELGVLIIAGGWIESLFLLTQIIQTDRDPAIISRIGEQQTPLDNLIELLQPHYGQKSEEFDFLLESLVNLSIIFDAIEVKYIYEAPTIDPENNLTIINCTTTYNISDEELVVISEKIEELRSWIIAE
ncbi:MAG: hypothetical protein JXL97_19690 [Bacteroidales bacterium]|nr:hypothetical protein [Bacteroidales bacterium]